MRRGGSRVHEPITRYKPCQRELRLHIALNPPMAYDRMLGAGIYLVFISFNLFFVSM